VEDIKSNMELCDDIRFAKDVEDFEVEVLMDNGIYRHIRCGNSDTIVHHFNIITWPGSLCISGDMGTYNFSRTKDMFNFFRGDKINPGYWAEKLTSICKLNDYREYCSSTNAKYIKDYFNDYWEDREDKSGKDECWEEIEDQILQFIEIDESTSREAVQDFQHNGFEFVDAWEWHLTQSTYHYIWCLRAIVWAINEYDKIESE